MYEKELYEYLAADPVFTSFVSAYRMSQTETRPSIFDDEAPESAVFPYLVFRIEEYPVDAAVSRFNVVFDYFSHRSKTTRTKAREMIDVLKKLLICQDIQTERFGQVRHYELTNYPVSEADSRAIHYHITCNARGVNEKWLKSLT